VRAGELAARQALVDLAYAEGMEALAARWLPPMVWRDRADDPALMGPLTEMVKRATPAMFEGQIRALLHRPDTGPALAAVACPTAVIVGRHDAWSPISQHEAIVEAIPGARLTVIEDAGHMAQVEQPEAVAEVLMDWLHGAEAPLRHRRTHG
jgi:pimeloyl-ACP methyl ester carboxylesterase